MIRSAGIIPYRKSNKTGELEFFVGHPGGPFWSEKDYWALLKGTANPDEPLLETAIREFQEESGITLTDEDKEKIWYVSSVKQRRGKMVYAYALDKPDINPSECVSNQADGCTWNEIDKFDWLPYQDIVAKTHPTNVDFFVKIKDILNGKQDREQEPHILH